MVVGGQSSVVGKELTRMDRINRMFKRNPSGRFTNHHYKFPFHFRDGEQDSFILTSLF